MRKRYLKSKIKNLKLDLKKTTELIKTLQKECFIAHKINTDTYHDRVIKYEERIAEIKHSLPVLEARLVMETFSYLGKIKGLFKRGGVKAKKITSKVTTKNKEKNDDDWNNKKVKKKVVEKKSLKKKKKNKRNKTDEVSEKDIKKNLKKILKKK